MLVIPALGRWKLGDQKLRVILNYIANSRPTWATRELVSKREKIKKYINKIGLGKR